MGLPELLLALELQEQLKQNTEQPDRPAETAEAPPRFFLNGSAAGKYRLHDGTAAVQRDSDGRFRLNLAVKADTALGTYVAGTRHDAPMSDLMKGYGADFLRIELHKGEDASLQAGLFRLKLESGKGIPYGQVFVKGKPCAFHANVPLSRDADSLMVATECTWKMRGYDVRALALDRLDVPRVQNVEIEGSSPPIEALGGIRLQAGVGVFGGPERYKPRIEFGVTKSFSYEHRKRER